MTYLNPARYFPVKATLWRQKLQDGYGSEGWEPPLVIACRWEDATQEHLSLAYAADGELLQSNALVFTKFELRPGDYLYRGETTETNPARMFYPKAFVIRRVAIMPSIKNHFSENIAYL